MIHSYLILSLPIYLLYCFILCARVGIQGPVHDRQALHHLGVLPALKFILLFIQFDI